MRWTLYINLAAFLALGAANLAATTATANAVPGDAAPDAAETALTQSAAGTAHAQSTTEAALTQSAAGPPDVRGSWQPETYRLKSGPVHEVTGLITFTEKDWSVLFFIVTDEGPRRGSGEGGTYTLDGDKLTFRHLYNLSGGHAVDGFEASDLSMRVRTPDAEDAPAEPCTITIEEDLLTIFFPSGNQMTFRRSSD